MNTVTFDQRTTGFEININIPFIPVDTIIKEYSQYLPVVLDFGSFSYEFVLVSHGKVRARIYHGGSATAYAATQTQRTGQRVGLHELP